MAYPLVRPLLILDIPFYFTFTCLEYRPLRRLTIQNVACSVWFSRFDPVQQSVPFLQVTHVTDIKTQGNTPSSPLIHDFGRNGPSTIKALQGQLAHQLYLELGGEHLPNTPVIRQAVEQRLNGLRHRGVGTHLPIQ